MMRRRDLLVIGSAMAVAVAIPPVLRRIPSRFEFEPLQGFEGFRRLKGGSFSGASNPFIGLDMGLTVDASSAVLPLNDTCLSIFGPSGWTSDVPIAIFSDFNCPYCQVLEARLMALRDSGLPVRLMWHEMPLLGPSSVRSARAVLAARILNVEAQARAHLKTHVLRPGPMALAALADEIGVSTEALQREYEGQQVSNILAKSLALGERLGIPGTPGTVVGRTLVIGAISEVDLKALIALERETPQTVCA